MSEPTITPEVWSDLWTDLCEKDDRTSPPDYPDMALITEDEFYWCLAQAVAAERAEHNDLIARTTERARKMAVFDKLEAGVAGRIAGRPTPQDPLGDGSYRGPDERAKPAASNEELAAWVFPNIAFRPGHKTLARERFIAALAEARRAEREQCLAQTLYCASCAAAIRALPLIDARESNPA